MDSHAGRRPGRQNNISLRAGRAPVSKLVELAGFAMVGGTVYAFMVPIPQQEPHGWPLFWACAAGALAVIVHRRLKRRAAGSNISDTA